MSRGELMEWIDRSSYRSAVFHAISRPRSGKQILELSRNRCPKISYQDIRHILRDFGDRGLVRCLNPSNQTGRLYLRCIGEVRGFSVESGEVVKAVEILTRGKSRLAVILHVAKPIYGKSFPKTASIIRKGMLENYAMSLSWVISTLHYLRQMGLIEVVSRTRKRDLPIYGITESGRQALAEMGFRELDYGGGDGRQTKRSPSQVVFDR